MSLLDYINAALMGALILLVLVWIAGKFIKHHRGTPSPFETRWTRVWFVLACVWVIIWGVVANFNGDYGHFNWAMFLVPGVLPVALPYLLFYGVRWIRAGKPSQQARRM